MRTKNLFPAAVVEMVTGVLILLGSSAASTAQTEVTVPRVEAQPKVDHFASAAARAAGLATTMARVDGFVTRLPRDGDALSEKTEVYLGYDDEALHAVFVCFDRDPSQIRAHLVGRDRIPDNEDSVALQLDTFRDLIHANGFQVNPLGVQQDGMWTEGKGWDLSPDAIWRTEGRLTDEGYVVVISVPFRSLRFPKGDSKQFGVLLFRGIARTSEEAFWPSYSTKIQGRMNQAGLLVKLDGVQPGRNMQIAPYVNSRAYRTLESARPRRYTDDPFDGAIGADGKVVVRGSLSLDFTANPDFSQVESDEPQVAVNQRFELFFPEKRPFFLENAPYFDTPIPLFFSRRVKDPDVGARLSGRLGRTAIGALVSRDAATNDATVGVLRLNRDVGAQSTVGFFSSLWSAGEGSSDRDIVGGLDGRARLGKSWSLTGQFAASSRERGSETREGFAARAIAERAGRSFTFRADYSERSKDFGTSLGFIERVDVRSSDATAKYRVFPKVGSALGLLSFGPDLALSYVADRSGDTLERFARPSLTFAWPRLTQLTLYRREGDVRLRASEFPLADPVATFSERFSQDLWGSSFGSSPTSSLTFFVDGSVGRAINLAPAAGDLESAARQVSWTASLDFRPGSRLGLGVSFLGTRLDRAFDHARVFSNRIVRAKAHFQFTRTLSARAIAQYDVLEAAPARTSLASRRRFNADLLFTYLLHPGTAIYVGFNDNLADHEGDLRLGSGGFARRSGGLLSDGRQFFVKASYLFRR